MKSIRRITGALLALALLTAVAPLAEAQTPYYFWTGVRNELGQPITSGVSCQVYTAGSDTPSALASDLLGTAKANPFAADSNGVCSFYMSAGSAVDLIVWHKRGRARFDNFSVNDHSVIINQQSAGRWVRIPFATSATSQVNTGVTIPKGARVSDVLIEVTVAATGAHIAIGTLASESGGNSAGFCTGGTQVVGDQVTYGKSLESTGWHKCHAVLISGSSAVGYYAGAFHSGAYISRGGIGVATGHAGSYFRFPYVGDGVAKTVAYTTSGHTVAGHFYLLFDEVGND